MNSDFSKSILAEIESRRDRIKYLQSKLEEQRNSSMRLEAQDSILKEQLREKFGIDSWEEAEIALGKIEKELTDRASKLQGLIEHIENYENKSEGTT